MRKVSKAAVTIAAIIKNFVIRTNTPMSIDRPRGTTTIIHSLGIGFIGSIDLSFPATGRLTYGKNTQVIRIAKWTKHGRRFIRYLSINVDPDAVAANAVHRRRRMRSLPTVQVVDNERVSITGRLCL
jgi:hypothetical protein